MSFFDDLFGGGKKKTPKRDETPVWDYNDGEYKPKWWMNEFKPGWKEKGWGKYMDE